MSGSVAPPNADPVGRTAVHGPGREGPGGWEIAVIGTWYMSLAFSLFLVLIGIYIHWSVVLIGALLPLWPMIATLIGRRRARASGADRDASTTPHDPDGDG